MESSGLKSFFTGADLAAAEQDDAEEVPIEEELVEEVMRELYREIHHHSASSSAAASALFPAETCGASVSESASTVMAGIDHVGKAMDGGDEESEEDDGWLARVMSWGPLDLDFVF